jgi:peroxiredoxin
MSESALVREKQEIGLPVSDFTLRQVGGESRTLGDFLEGKKGAVICFWSGICSHCLRYDAYMNDFAARHPDFSFFAIASRHDESAEQVAAAIKERNLSFPILYDPKGVVARQWYVQQTPRVFLVAADGRKLLYRGAIDNFKFDGDAEFQPYLEPAMAQFLAGEPIAKTETASFGCAIQSVYYILPKPLF